MKTLLKLVFALYCCVGYCSAATWYVDAVHGGSRYSVDNTFGQCNGTAATTYPGPVRPEWQPATAYTTGTVVLDNNGHYETAASNFTSGSSNPAWGGGSTPDNGGSWTQGSAFLTNQNCPFNDVHYLWQTGAYTTGSDSHWGWVGAGGDTYHILGSISDSVYYPTGWPVSSNCFTANGFHCFGIAGDSANSGMPHPPAGTAGAHTKILGGNAGACTSLNARTQLVGTWGAGHVMDLVNESFVDVGCLDLTTFASCSASIAGDCNGLSWTSNGIEINNVSHDITITDLRAHRFRGSGIHGPTGGNVVASDIKIDGNAHGGWDTDDGTTGVGSLLIQDFDISWNGCAEEYPDVDSMPYHKCTDQSHSGYGDGFGTASLDSPAPGWQVTFLRGSEYYNTQDGLDALHVAGPGSVITVSQVLGYGSMGQQLKVGGAATNAKNNVLIGNDTAMCNGFPGPPVGFNTLLSDCGRPSGEHLPVFIDVSPGAPSIFQDNLVFSQGTINVEVEYAQADQGVTNTLNFDDNILVGFPYPGGGPNPTPIFSNTNLNMLTNSGASWTHNSYFGYRGTWTCPATGESNAVCSNPNLATMTLAPYGYSNYAPTGAPLVGAGSNPSGISTIDFNGATRLNPQTIGPCEFTDPCPVAATPTVAIPTASPVAGTYSSTQNVTLSDATPSAAICFTTNGATPTASVAGTCDGTPTQTYSTPIPIASTTTIKAIGTLAGSLNSSVFSGTWTITIPSSPQVTVSGAMTISGTVTVQ